MAHKCIICNETWGYKITCCKKEICLQCIFNLERKQCPNCRKEPISVKSRYSHKIYKVKNTRGYTQDSPVIEDIVDTPLDLQIIQSD